MGEDGFVTKETKLFLLPLHEALALPSGDNDGIGLHRFKKEKLDEWNRGIAGKLNKVKTKVKV
jgi:hypothetical protein